MILVQDNQFAKMVTPEIPNTFIISLIIDP
jgi:hypothetical protein